MADVQLTVMGSAYGGWKSARVTRGIESLAGNFSLTVSDRWPGEHEWPIHPEDICDVLLEKGPVLSGYVDVRNEQLTATAHEITIEGRDKAGALVDCSAVLDKWEFAKIGVLELCAKVAEPFGVNVSLQDGVSDTAISTNSTTASGKPRAVTGSAPAAVGTKGKSSAIKLGNPVAKLTINPGDSPAEVIDRACRIVGLMAVSDGQGGVVLTRVGGAKAVTPLVEGINILSWSIQQDATRRYRRYIVSGQQPGSDDVPGAEAAAVTAETSDLAVRRSERVILIRPDAAVTLDFARSYAAWEMTVRKAKSESMTVTVQGWQQASGQLWPINGLVDIRIPSRKIQGQLLISETTFELSERGSTTTLKLCPKDAFLPETTIQPTTAAANPLAWLLG